MKLVLVAACICAVACAPVATDIANDGGIQLTTDETAAIGTYTLSGSATGGLPIATGATTGNCPRIVTGGSLELKNNLTFTLTVAMRADCPPPTNVVTNSVQTNGTWQAQATALTLTQTGNGSALTLSNTTVSGGVAAMTAAFDWAGPVNTSLVFRR